MRYRPKLVQCVADLGCPVLDTDTGEIVGRDQQLAYLADGAYPKPVIASVVDVRAALGFPYGPGKKGNGITYMARCLAAVRLDWTVLEVLYPRQDSEKRGCPISSQGLTLLRLGQEIDPKVAELLIELRASAREVEAVGKREHRGDPRCQLQAAQRFISGVRNTRRGGKGAAGTTETA